MRRFNRFYTQRIGVLQEGLLGSPFSLAQGRVLYELAHRDTPTASELGRDLGLDAGYLSRIVRGFEKRGLLKRTPSKADGRQHLLSLTARGRAAFAPLDARSRDEIGAMLGRLSTAEQNRLTEAMRAIETLLGAPPEPKVPYILRPHRPGDMGWVVHRHGALYAQEYGWDERFEALVAGIVAKFIEHYDARRERCWIADKDGESVGSVFLVKRSKTEAKLRLLLVEPKARGLGIGGRLVDECVRFARLAGYRKITLWTNSVLRSARRIYQAAGFRLVHRERHESFGHDLVGETWELKL
ncbi:MAG TPA: bifunctional helix-turn-helix transcriptional regulator/GNAT family N-acetyltransferase [Methylomirabilota bacterium]|jgi:DNA-binding MarR family transcriptional regulator/N-acetylglutamate synthase-like GNAT family acetyltransferase|nr:bifunctional helix-turn-helix transcriptional regulator/GNAT family N-acetyltransferase [Methylomirabilota bacterium]